MKNVYDGLVTLDSNGEAIVELPEFFESLNRDVRYQVTPNNRRLTSKMASVCMVWVAMPLSGSSV